MVAYIAVANKDDLKNGEMKAFNVRGLEILLARVADKFFAASNRCPHMGGKLDKGKLEGTIVTCPKHASQFDLVDGRVVRWTGWSGITVAVVKLVRPPRKIDTYPVKVEGNKVMVEI